MDTAHSVVTSPFLVVVVSLLGFVLLGLLVAGIIYMLRMGVQFAIQDLLVGTLTVGFPPAIGGMLAGTRHETVAYRLWVPAGSLSFLVLIYLIYSFYWASIRPHPDQKSRFWQRFAVPMSLAVLGSIFLWISAPKAGSQEARLDDPANATTTVDPADPTATPTPADPTQPVPADPSQPTPPVEIPQPVLPTPPGTSTTP